MQLTADTIRVSAPELSEAHAQADPRLLEAVRRVAANIREFQKAILHRDVRLERPGGYLAQRYRPLDRVGICVPGGAAAYPSTVLMTAVPAQVAGVKELVVVAPPTKFGAYNADMLATCCELGIREVYRLGGAQAVAAMAYGIQGLPRVDKIVGPGNLFVALAKQRVFGDVDIDSIAGPSEVVVIVDDSTCPEFTAMDLIAQAEHAPVRKRADRLERRRAAGGRRRAFAAIGPRRSRRVGAAKPGRVRRGDSRPRCRRSVHPHR